MGIFSKKEESTFKTAQKVTPESVAAQFISNTQSDTNNSLQKIQQVANKFIPQSSRTRNKDLDSSKGLYNLAVQNGLQGQADRILQQQTGEETKKIFSGGFISDVFDTLNAIQYGVVGVLKGKSFAEGVKTRQSFSDKDALGSKGLPGVIGGILLDIAVDPLTYIAPYTIVKKVPLLGKAFKALEALVFGKKVTKTIKVAKGVSKTYDALEGGTKVGKYAAQKLGWMFGADPIFRKTFERSVKNTAISTKGLVDMVKPIADLSPKTAAKLLMRDDTGRFIRVPLEGLKGTLTGGEFSSVKKVFNKLDKLGKEAVDVGLLGKGKYAENVGEYIKNAYQEFEQAKAKGIFGYSKIGIKGIKKRVKGLTPEAMKELGQIDNPAYLLFKSTVDLSKDIENIKLFNAVNKKFGTEIAQEGFSQIPKTARFIGSKGKQADILTDIKKGVKGVSKLKEELISTKVGDLAGKYVPDQMKKYLTEIINPAKNTVEKQVVANFKFFKVIMNPATHARNMVSNKLLNWWKIGMNPLDPRVIASDLEATKEIFKGSGKWIDLATPHGYSLNTFASAELKHLLDLPEVSAWGKGVSGWKKMQRKLGNIYQGEENLAKLSAFIFNSKKGLGAEEAWKLAESATFNYAQVTPFIRKLRESLFGLPFITFTVKSTPLVAETLIKAPHRISAIGKIKNGIENLSDIKMTARERAAEPSWVKDGFYIKLPMKDKQGRSAYFDLTYILPFGDLLAGNFFEKNRDLSTGLPESQANAIMKKLPFIQVVSQVSRNKDFYGNSIWKNTDNTTKQTGDLMRHLLKTYIPPLVGDQLPGGYNYKGERQQRGIVGAVQRGEEDIGQKRNLMQELMRNVGAKVQPIDADIQETYQEWNKKKALQNLLLENGIGSNFERFYVPKEETTTP